MNLTSDQELRLECARIAAAFGATDDIAATAERLYQFIKNEERGDEPVR